MDKEIQIVIMMGDIRLVTL